MSPELAVRLGDVSAALRGPATLRPLDVLVAAHETQTFDAAAYCQLVDLVEAHERTIRILERRLARAENPHAARLFERLDAQHRELRELRQPIAAKAPALEQWRRDVLQSRLPHSPIERAAAWELTALEAERLGADTEADHARTNARLIINAAALGAA